MHQLQAIWTITNIYDLNAVRSVFHKNWEEKKKYPRVDHKSAYKRHVALCKNFKKKNEKRKRKTACTHTKLWNKFWWKSQKTFQWWNQKELKYGDEWHKKCLHTARKLAEHIVSSLWTLATHTIAKSMNWRKVLYIRA